MAQLSHIFLEKVPLIRTNDPTPGQRTTPQHAKRPKQVSAQDLGSWNLVALRGVGRPLDISVGPYMLLLLGGGGVIHTQ